MTTGLSKMQEPTEEDNLAFEGAGVEPREPLVVQNMLAIKDRRASELTESMLRYNRRDQNLAHVSCPNLKTPLSQLGKP